MWLHIIQSRLFITRGLILLTFIFWNTFSNTLKRSSHVFHTTKTLCMWWCISLIPSNNFGMSFVNVAAGVFRSNEMFKCCKPVRTSNSFFFSLNFRSLECCNTHFKNSDLWITFILQFISKVRSGLRIGYGFVIKILFEFVASIRSRFVPSRSFPKTSAACTQNITHYVFFPYVVSEGSQCASPLIC